MKANMNYSLTLVLIAAVLVRSGAAQAYPDPATSPPAPTDSERSGEGFDFGCCMIDNDCYDANNDYFTELDKLKGFTPEDGVPGLDVVGINTEFDGIDPSNDTLFSNDLGPAGENCKNLAAVGYKTSWMRAQSGSAVRCYENKCVQGKVESEVFTARVNCKDVSCPEDDTDRDICSAKDVVGACDDPHFTGFGHEKYDFMGEEGKVYSLFSEKSTQINAQMKTLNVPGEDGTYLGTCAVVFRGEAATDRISVEAVEGSRIIVKVNDEIQEVVDLKAGLSKTLASGAQLRMLSTDGAVLDVARITLKTLTVDFLGLGHHLDMVVQKVAAGLCNVHGVLGQTYKGMEYLNGAARPEDIKALAGKVFDIEKKSHRERDYMVSGMFGTDDSFSSFDRECPVAAVTRKLLNTPVTSSIVCAGTSNIAACEKLRML